jgi:hypothetical protein
MVTSGDFGNHQICQVLNLSETLIGVGFTYMCSEG